MRKFKPGQKVVFKPDIPTPIYLVICAGNGVKPLEVGATYVIHSCMADQPEWYVLEGSLDEMVHYSILYPLEDYKNPDLYLKLEPKKVLEKELIIQN